MSDYYTVEFRIYGDSLEFAKISKQLGLIPTSTQMKGEHFKRSMWGYGEREEGKGLREWCSLEEGIHSLLARLAPVKNLIERLEHSDTILWCGHFKDGFSSGPVLSHSLIKELAEWNFELNISTYIGGEDK